MATIKATSEYGSIRPFAVENSPFSAIPWNRGSSQKTAPGDIYPGTRSCSQIHIHRRRE